MSPIAWDMDRLEAMRGLLEERGVRSVAVADGDGVVWSWHADGRDRPAAVYSITKSVLSLLIGIAIRDGLIGGPDDRIADYLELPRDAHPKMASVRIRHLLSMTSGIDWPDFDKPYWAMRRSADAVRFVLSRPVAHEPGTAFAYNTGGSHLLAAILQAAAGSTVLDYARRRLFEPLGIRRVKWNALHGVHEGGTGLYLKTADLIKIGMLAAREGEWEGRRIVPAEWIRESMKPVTKGLLHYKPPIFGRYGWHWWVADPAEGRPGYAFALGFSGQYLAVVPELGIAAAVRRIATTRADSLKSRSLIDGYILPAATKADAGWR
jgi:CubicO group peptidase (beta-lactamase class C family)